MPPVRSGALDGPTVVTQLCHADVFMYLVAIHSLTRYVTPRRVVVLDDGSLTAADHDTLRGQVEGLDIRSIADVANPACPSGGTWERLLTIADLVPEGYVIQVDADTLTFAEPSEVLQCVRESKSFTLGTHLGRTVISMEEASRNAQEMKGGHIQVLAESLFHKLPDAARLRYIRGNSGFAGFARDSFARPVMYEFSRGMTELVGAERWSEWGTEQITSSFVVANSPAPYVLPFERYRYYKPGSDMDDTVFLHFIGPFRFHGGRYAVLGAEIAAELGS